MAYHAARKNTLTCSCLPALAAAPAQMVTRWNTGETRDTRSHFRPNAERFVCLCGLVAFGPADYS